MLRKAYHSSVLKLAFSLTYVVNTVSKYKFAFQPVCASIQPAATTSDKANQTRSPGEVGGEQTFDVTHMWKMTFDSGLTLLVNARIQS